MTTLKELLLGVQRVSSRRIVSRPHTHRVPGVVMWVSTLLTAVCMALINFFSLLAIEYTLRWKFSVMQRVIGEAGVALGILVLVVISVMYSAIGVTLILFWAPQCGGSGLPESKCYLNGSNMPSFFTVRTLLVRIATSILANAAGFPVGREGPTVTIGGNLAYLVSHRFTMPYMRQWIRVSGSVPAVLVDEERFAHATRINCAVGGACAMAMLFNTPIGGLLYMFEEISPASWPVELTFRAFVATTVCSLFSYWLLDLVNKEIREFVIFAMLPEDKEYSAADIPVFVVIAAAIGAVTALHTRMMLGMARVRKQYQSRFRCPKLGIFIETVCYAALCAVVSGLISLLCQCRQIGESGLTYVQFNCKEGEYNPVASLLVNTSHSSVKLLFSGNNAGEIRWRSTALAFLAYFTLNVGLAGLPVPGGAFTATMLLGGLAGRCIGSIMREGSYTSSVSGVYAVVGASAMLCGFKQMAAAVVLIVVQCVNDFNITPVVMLSVSVALAVNRSINVRGHDEEQIERKKLPYLDSEVPTSLDNFVARDLIDELPAMVEFPRHASLELVEAALEVTRGTPWTDFPVLDGRQCVGMITRVHLSAALRAHAKQNEQPSPTQAQDSNGGSSSSSIPAGGDANKVRRSEAVLIARVASGLALDDAGRSPVPVDTIPLDRIMDSTPFTIHEDMPAPRFYSLFAKAGESAACVTSKTGEYRGIVSRTGLIAACRREAAERH